jgi:hypothetical protein
MMPNLRDSEPDARASLDEVCSLLQAHPDFRELPVTRVAKKSRTGKAIGRFIKSMRLLNFGAEFARSITLLHFQIHQDQPRVLAMDLRWHIERIPDDWSVFVHFVDDAGAIRFQGDYPLQGETPDPLGLVYSRRLVAVPAEVPPGEYRIRLGVWSPGSAAHLQLTRFRGCERDPVDWCRNAVVLGSVTI